MRTPLVSVLLSVYNSAKFLPDAIKSVLTQDYQNIEILAVNDGSRDDSLAILRQYPKIIVYTQNERGESKTRNRLIKLARGEYVSFLDPDDLYYPGRISKQLAPMVDDQSIMMTTSLCHGFVDHGMTAPAWVRSASLNTSHTDLSPSGWLIRKSLFDQIGRLDESLNSGCDFEWIYRVKNQGLTILQVEDVLWGKRYHQSNASAFVDHSKIGRYYHELLTILKK